MMGHRFFLIHRLPGRTGRCRSDGHTLIEVATVVLVLAILACAAIPRLNFGAVRGAKIEAVVARLATDLRRTRAAALAGAARNPDGFVLALSGDDPCRNYQIVDRRSRAVLATGEIPPEVRCRGGRRFQFGPLGNLLNGSDTHLRLETEGRAYLLEIVPATGAVEWRRCDERE
ncbi:MAG: hypothetical protein MUC88_09700 [Planctomycetes bacterium]|jgi:type II secretory pathway pseudopilin PulG|nr:hypothetical protein [Planctomycetota bacterium]